MPKTSVPAKKVYSMRLSDYTLQQINELAPLFGSRANVIQVAVDQLYQVNHKATEQQSKQE